MDHFTVHRLQFKAEVRTPLELNAHQGSAIRGALYHALRGRFCAYRAAAECRQCPLNLGCPVCTLVSTLSPESERGADIPRPYTVQVLPASPEQTQDGIVRYEPGDCLTFGLALFSQALQLFPYVILAVHAIEESGLGRKVAENGWRRGQFVLRRVWADNPLTGEYQDVLESGSTRVKVPDVPITHAQVMACASALRPRQVTLRFHTPTRLVHHEQLVKPNHLAFRPLIHRLLDRLECLSRDFCDTPLTVDFPDLLACADSVRLVDNQTRWVELMSYSTRQGRATPISGLVGSATFEADDFGPFLPWLLWGQFVHVGKDAVKGNGWYTLIPH